MGFIIHFYIIFGTNLLTGGPAQNCCFLPISEFRRKRISNGVQTEWNLRERDFRNEREPEDLDPTSRHQPGGHEVGGGRLPPGRTLHPRGPLVAPSTYFFLLYIPTHPENIRGGAKTLFPLPQPSVPKRSHLGAFPELRQRGYWSWRVSTSTPWPLWWCVSSLPQTFGSIASSYMASSLSLDLNTKFSSILLEIYLM